MLQFINYRMRVTVQDNRVLIGKFMAFDRHMNLILGDCEEFRKISGKSKKEEREDKRPLGLLLLRGECIVSLSVEGPPTTEESRFKTASSAAAAGPGKAIATGRGIAMPPVTSAPAGLAGPVRGIGGPGAAIMAPPGMPGMQGMPGMPPGMHPGMSGRGPMMGGPMQMQMQMRPGMPGMPPGMPGMQGMPMRGMGMPPGMPPGMMGGPPPGMMGGPPPGMMGGPPPGMMGGPPPGMMPPGMMRGPPPGMMPPGMMRPPGRQ